MINSVPKSLDAFRWGEATTAVSWVPGPISPVVSTELGALDSNLGGYVSWRWDIVKARLVPESLEHPAVTAKPFRKELILYYNERYRRRSQSWGKIRA